MPKILKILFKEEVFILICLFIITILGLLPTLLELLKYTPPDRVFTFAHNYMADYYQYLSWMKDGANGKLLITSRFSSDLFPREPVYLFYSVWGLIWSKLGLNLYFGYTFIRILFSISKLLVIYLLIAELFTKANARKLIFAIVVFLPAFYYLSPLSLYLPQISSVDVLQRTFFLPHDLITACLLILGSIYLSRFIEKKRDCHYPIGSDLAMTEKKYLIFTAVCFFVASITNPSHLLIFYLFIGVALGLQLLLQPKSYITIFVAGFISLIAGLPLIIYYQHLFATVLPFSWMFAQQKVMSLNINFWQYLISLGPVMIFFLFGIPDFLKQKTLLPKIIITWALIPFALFPLFGNIIPISQERIFEMSHFIPLGILTGTGISWIWRKIPGRKKTKGVIGIIGISMFITFCLPYYYIAEKTQLQMYSPPYFNFYVPKSTIAAYVWLDKNTPDESVVATSYFSGNMLPAWSHNRVVHGHDFVTYQSADRLAEINALFSQATPISQIIDILKKERVSYILFTPETPLFETTNLSLLKNLQLIYKNEGNLVFEYKK